MITEYADYVNNFRRSNWREAVWSRRGIRYDSIREGLKPTRIKMSREDVSYYMRVLDARRYNTVVYGLKLKGVEWE